MTIQSTADQARHFIVLSVKRDDAHQWGELQRFEYVDGDKFKTKKAARRHAETARMRWADNYHQFRDAKFAIADTADIPAPSPKIRMTMRDQERRDHIAKLDNTKQSIEPGFVAHRGQYGAARRFMRGSKAHA